LLVKPPPTGRIWNGLVNTLFPSTAFFTITMWPTGTDDVGSVIVVLPAPVYALMMNDTFAGMTVGVEVSTNGTPSESPPNRALVAMDAVVAVMESITLDVSPDKVSTVKMLS